VTTPQTFEDGTRFGRYAIITRIGAGGMAEVYEAVHLGLKKRVAIKVLRPDMTAREDLRRRFVREAEAMARIQHPHVVDVSDVGSIDGVCYLVMEYLEGESLEDRLARTGRIDVQPLVHIMLPVVAAMATSHEQGVVHRDLKPDNIFLSADGQRRVRPKVLDFGISRMLDTDTRERHTLAATVLGTPHYMAPEQARGEPTVDHKSDQYAVGVILYEAATGQLPRNCTSILELLREVGHGSFDPPRTVLPSLPEAFEAVILRAMADRPEDRYPTMRDVGRALLPFASDRAREYWGAELSAEDGDGLAAVTAVEAPRVARRDTQSLPGQPEAVAGQPLVPAGGAKRPRRLLYAALALAGLLMLLGGGLWWSHDGPETGPVLVSQPQASGAPPSRTGPEMARLHVEPAHARVELDGERLGRGDVRFEVPADGKPHQLTIRAPGYEAQTVVFRESPPPASVELVPRPEAPAAQARPRSPAAARARSRPRPRAVRRPRARERAEAPPRPVDGASGPEATESSSPEPVPAQADAEPSKAPGSPSRSWPRPTVTDNRDPWLP
jgi:serine/threonine-protein kinase